MKQNDVKLGKFISLILRHHPETIHLKLDEQGWADLEQLINGINQYGLSIDRTILDRIVTQNDKQRYSYNEDKTKIRANQGHSISVNLELTSVVPPDILYHGTASRFTGSIFQEGITKQSRQYVHLSSDYKTALSVGSRHGTPVVLKIYASRMYQDGYSFYLSENHVWLTPYIPVKYIEKVTAK